MWRNRPLNNTVGFTLVELLVTITILAIVMVSLVAVLTQSILAHQQMVAQASLQDKAVMVEKQLSSDISGAYMLLDASNDRIHLIDQNYTDSSPSYISYYLDNGKLYRVHSTDGSPHYSGGDLIADGITSLQFNYLEWTYYSTEDEQSGVYDVDYITDLGSLSGNELHQRLLQIHQVDYNITFMTDGCSYSIDKQIKLRNNLRT